MVAAGVPDNPLVVATAQLLGYPRRVSLAQVHPTQADYRPAGSWAGSALSMSCAAVPSIVPLRPTRLAEVRRTVAVGSRAAGSRLAVYAAQSAVAAAAAASGDIRQHRGLLANWGKSTRRYFATPRSLHG